MKYFFLLGLLLSLSVGLFAVPVPVSAATVNTKLCFRFADEDKTNTIETIIVQYASKVGGLCPKGFQLTKSTVEVQNDLACARIEDDNVSLVWFSPSQCSTIKGAIFKNVLPAADVTAPVGNGVCSRVADSPKDPKKLTPADVLVMNTSSSGACPAGWQYQSTSAVDGKICLLITSSNMFGFKVYDAATKKCLAGYTVKDVTAYVDTGASGGTKPIADATVKFPDLNQVIGTLDNPLGVTTVLAFLLRVTRILVSVLGIAATAVIIISALTMIVAAGNTKLIAQAKTALLYAFLGFVLALMSFSLVAIFQNLLQSRL